VLNKNVNADCLRKIYISENR